MATLRLAIDARAAAAGAAAFDNAAKRVAGSALQADAALTKQNATMARSGVAAKAMGSQFKAMMVPLVGFFAVIKAVKTIASFEERMRQVQQVTQANEAAFAALTERARELGATTRFSATQAAEGLLELSRAGFDANEAMDAVGATLDLAVAGSLELGEATGFVANAIRQFGLDASEANRVADAFVVVANNANTDVRQLAEALKFAGTVAASVGMSVEETAAAIGVLGDRGVKASLAGTQLRGTLLGLASPTDGAAAAMAKLGIQFDEINPATHSLHQIAVRLKQGIDSLANPLEAAGIFADIFGRRNAAAALALADANEKLAENTRLAEESVAAHSDFAAAMNDTIIGAWKSLVSAIEEAMLVTGDAGVGSALKATLEVIAETVRMLAGVEGAFKKASTGAKILSVAIIALTARMVALRAVAIVGWLFGFVRAAWAAAAASTGLTASIRAMTVAMAANPATALAVALTAIGSALFFAKGEARDAAGELEDLKAAQQDLVRASQDLRDAQDGVNRAVETGSKGGLVDALQNKMAGLKDTMEKLAGAAESFQGDLFFGDLAVPAGKARAALPGLDLPVYREGSVTRGGFGRPMRGMGGTSGREMVLLEDAAEAVAKALKEVEDRLAELGRPELTTQPFSEAEMAVGDLLDSYQRELEILALRGTTYEETLAIQEAARQAMKAEADLLEKISAEDRERMAEKIQALNAARKAVANLQRDEQEAARLAAQASADAAAAAERNARQRADQAQGAKEYVAGLRTQAGMERLRLRGDSDTAELLEALNGLRRYGNEVTADQVQETMRLVAALQELNAANEDAVKVDERRRQAEGAGVQLERNLALLKDEMSLRSEFGTEREIALATLEAERLATEALTVANDKQAAAIHRTLTEYKALVAEQQKLEQQRALAEGFGQAMTDALFNIVEGTNSAKEALEGLAKDMLRIFMDMYVRSYFTSAFAGIFGPAPSAHGNAFQFGRAKAYAKGGVVNQPTFFNTMNGLGVAGEAGEPEAILPLKRGADGDLGVKVQGGNTGRPVTVHMNITTKDADSFRRSRVQIQEDMRRATTALQ